MIRSLVLFALAISLTHSLKHKTELDAVPINPNPVSDLAANPIDNSISSQFPAVGTSGTSENVEIKTKG